MVPQDIAKLRTAASSAHQKGEIPKAMGLYAQYLALVPTDAGMWSNLGVLHRKAGRYHQALRAQERAQACNPDDVGLRNNYANILSDLGHYDQSIAVRQSILAQRPDDLGQKAMIGRCLRGKGAYHDAIAYLEAEIANHSEETELQMQLSFALLGAGDYAAAFDAYRARWQSDELTPRDLPYPEWAGEPLIGKTVLIMPEQGFGDAILFARFVPAIKALGAHVLFLAEKPVLPLFDGLEGADWVGVSLPKDAHVDYWINLMDMARVHFADSNAVPHPTQITVSEDSQARARAITTPYKDTFKVGVVWTGSVTYKGNRFRSFSHTDYLPLLEIPEVQIFSLYKGPELASFCADGTDAFIINAAASERHFGDSAAMMQEMDLVITSDTATAHLAGSLGVPCWVIVHWDPFWVWHHTGNTTQWYPGVRLFRQHVAFKWNDVIQDVQIALRQHVGGLR